MSESVILEAIQVQAKQVLDLEAFGPQNIRAIIDQTRPGHMLAIQLEQFYLGLPDYRAHFYWPSTWQEHIRYALRRWARSEDSWVAKLVLRFVREPVMDGDSVQVYRAICPHLPKPGTQPYGCVQFMYHQGQDDRFIHSHESFAMEVLEHFQPGVNRQRALQAIRDTQENKPHAAK